MKHKLPASNRIYSPLLKTFYVVLQLNCISFLLTPAKILAVTLNSCYEIHKSPKRSIPKQRTAGHAVSPSSDLSIKRENLSFSLAL